MENGLAYSIEFLLLFRTHTLSAKEAAKFECDPWPHATRFDSWKVFFLREVISGSSHPRVASDCFAETDIVTRMEELKYSGFALNKHNMKYEILDSKVVKGIMKVILDRFQKNINFSQDKHV